MENIQTEINAKTKLNELIAHAEMIVEQITNNIQQYSIRKEGLMV
jgi:hypothetical protein